MDDIALTLSRNLPRELYDRVFQYTVRSLFRESDLIKAEFGACMNNDIKYNKMLDDFIVYQIGTCMKFGSDDSYNNNMLSFRYKEEKDIDGLMALRMLRFKYLRIIESSDFTYTYVNFSDYISYHYNKEDPSNMFYVRKSHEVVMKDYQMSPEELQKLAESYPDKAFVISTETNPLGGVEKLRKYMEVVNSCPNIKLKVRYHFMISLAELNVWDRNYMNFVSLFNIPHPRIDVWTSLCYYADKHHGLLIQWLDKQLSQLGYDKLNHFYIDDMNDENVADAPAIDLRFIEKLINLEKLTIKGKFVINKETVGDLRGHTKLRQMKLSHDTYSHEWLSTCLPTSIERLNVFKSINSPSQYYPIHVSSLKCLIVRHEDNGPIYVLKTRDFDLSNTDCDVYIEAVEDTTRD